MGLIYRSDSDRTDFIVVYDSQCLEVDHMAEVRITDELDIVFLQMTERYDTDEGTLRIHEVTHWSCLLGPRQPQSNRYLA